jgi:hypothetical protein
MTQRPKNQIIDRMNATPKMKPETANGITRNIIRVVSLTKGAVAYRINNAAVFDAKAGAYRAGNIEKGLPDVIAILNGRFVGIEVKAGKDRMSDFQKMRRQEIVNAGGIYFECKSTDGFLAFWENLKNEMAL